MIKLSDILDLGDIKEYKAHCAVYNGKDQPLDDFARNIEDWHEWNKFKGTKNDFNRKYIFSLISFYHEPDTWLFGGIYKVIEVDPITNKYIIELDKTASQFIGRLKMKFKLIGRQRRIKLENIFNEIIVSEILKEPYSGQVFPGYENIDLGFEQLEIIIKNNKLDWQAALQNIKGIYLITDKKNGKKYIGSAYGDYGIWSRWQCYIETCHGGNDELTKLIKEKGIDYARNNFKFTLLEYRPTKVDDKVIIEREGFWKKALLTRDFGYNLN